jgi:hypothetical protein
MNETTSISERNNLLGQLDKGIKLCKQKDCLDKILQQFPDKKIKSFILGIENQLKLSNSNNC